MIKGILLVVFLCASDCLEDVHILTVDWEIVSFKNGPRKRVVFAFCTKLNLVIWFTVAFLLQVVGYAFDQVDDHLHSPYHETVYSLLDTLSPAYREAFGNALLQRLEALKRDGQSWRRFLLLEGLLLVQKVDIKLEILAYVRVENASLVLCPFLASSLGFWLRYYWLMNCLSSFPIHEGNPEAIAVTPLSRHSDFFV